jgi:hypothetical protein
VEYRTVQFDSAGRARYLEDVYDLDRKKDTTQAATVTEGICSVFDSGSTWLPLRLSCLAA